MQAAKSTSKSDDSAAPKSVHLLPPTDSSAKKRLKTMTADAAYTPARKPLLDAAKHQEEPVDRSSLITPGPPSLSSSTLSQPTPLSQQEVQQLLWKEAAYTKVENEKRDNYISWEDYFMAIANLSAHRSKDPQNPSGACLVDDRNRIIGIGYNGFPRGCSDDCLPWNLDNKEMWLHTAQPYLVHACVNAVLNRITSCAGARLYTKFFPCNDCAKVLVQTRIAKLIYQVDPDPDSDCSRASRILLQLGGVQVEQYESSRDAPYLDLDMTPSLNDATEEKCPSCPDAQADGVTDNQPSSTLSTETAANRYRALLQKEANYDPTLVSSSKRTDYLSWDDYFMAISFLTAQRSKDPNTQVGACIVDAQKRIIGLGYNGFPAGCSDDVLPWARQGTSALHTKYLYVCHSEVNAILNAANNVQGATLYVALFPCNECAKMIIQAGIREVVYLSDRYHASNACRASRIMFQMAGVTLRKHIPRQTKVRISFETNKKPQPPTTDNE